MNRKRLGLGGLESLISTSKDLFSNRMSSVPNGNILINAVRFRGKLGASIAVITSLIVGFLTIPNNILYFIDNKHGTKTTRDVPTCKQSPGDAPGGIPDYEYAYIHAGIALVTIGCLAMVVSIVLSYFAAKSKRKMDDAEGRYYTKKSTRTVIACLVMMNVELFMAVIAGCMEMLYRPLISDAQRLHSVECTIAVFNIVIYIMYVMTMVLTSTVLKGKHEKIPSDVQRDIPEAAEAAAAATTMPFSARDYANRSVHNTLYSQTSFM